MKLKKGFDTFILMSKRERNGLRVLLAILCIILSIRLALPLLMPDNEDGLNDLAAVVSKMEREADSLSVLQGHQSPAQQGTVAGLELNGQPKGNPGRNSPSDGTVSQKPYFDFDPNTANKNTLVELGFSERNANTIIKYREKGGKFYRRDDLKKIYGIDTSLVNQLIPYIKIESGKKELPAKKIEINQADTTAFKSLPGIGSVFARRICEYRQSLGGYYSVDQLLEVYKIPAETVGKIKPFLWADTSLIQKLNINFATFKELNKHPYCSFEQTKKIMELKSTKGPFKKIEELYSDSVFTREEFVKIAPYLVVQ